MTWPPVEAGGFLLKTVLFAVLETPSVPAPVTEIVLRTNHFSLRLFAIRTLQPVNDASNEIAGTLRSFFARLWGQVVIAKRATGAVGAALFESVFHLLPNKSAT